VAFSSLIQSQHTDRKMLAPSRRSVFAVHTGDNILMDKLCGKQMLERSRQKQENEVNLL
jgi:hypothetical protein